MTRGSPTSYDRGGEKERVREKTGAARTKARKKDPDEMPVKRREIVVKGRGEEEERRRGDPVLHPETIVTVLGRMRTAGRSSRAACIPLPVSYI